MLDGSDGDAEVNNPPANSFYSFGISYFFSSGNFCNSYTIFDFSPKGILNCGILLSLLLFWVSNNEGYGLTATGFLIFSSYSKCGILSVSFNSFI